MLWIAYGISLPNAAIIVPNSVAFGVGLITILLAARYRGGEVRPAGKP
jgi:hypothetical protein